MADEKKPENSGLTGAVPVTVVLALLANLLYSHLSPYQDERPSNHPLKDQDHYEAAQDVNARLWQDPFAAVKNANEETPKKNLSIKVSDGRTLAWEASLADESQSHDNNQIYKDNFPAPKDVITVIAVTLPGGPYQEAAEDRMRRRYAVLSALANQAATPRDEQHIGYFHMGLKERVAFEWWSLAEDNKKVLLLWVDESDLLGSPASKLKGLLQQTILTDQMKKEHKELNNVSFNYTVIGPNSSTLLRDMLKEVEATKNKPGITECSVKPNANLGEIGDIEPCRSKATFDPLPEGEGALCCFTSKPLYKPIVYYSAGATASNFLLLREALGVKVRHGETVSGYLQEQGITLHQTTFTDTEMMGIVEKELDRRRVKKTDHVVILSEWDTFYGRAMPKAFELAWNPDQANNKLIQTFGYMRGLDGKLPDKNDKSASVAEKKSDGSDKSNANTLIEFPEGENQKDYLRRLADHILKLDQEWKDQGDQKGVAAIGVLGSDVHDKLLILEALRQNFPHKLFFTTDLHAAYFHPAKWHQTHNLLVASAFDLKLRPELQGYIPPFRDSYQTALFLAMQLALNSETVLADPIFSDKIKNSPLLFEIGRSHPVSLPTNEDRLPLDNDESNKPQCSWTNWSACDNTVQPQIFANSPLKWTWKDVLVIFDVMGAALPFYFVSSWFRKKVKSALNYCKSDPYSIAGIILISCLIVYGLKFYFNQINAEPFYWLEGVSIWPSQLLRILIVLFVWFFCRWGHQRIKKMEEDLKNEIPSTFVLPNNWIPPKFLEVLFIGDWKRVRDQDDILKVQPEKLWEKYLGYSGLDMPVTSSPWFLRVVIHVLVFFLAAGILISQTGIPNVPARGDFAQSVNFCLIILAVLSTIFLITWVVENARLCERLIDDLSAKPSKWTDEAEAWTTRVKKVPPECADDWLDIHLVARLTATMQPLIFGPVVCIALLILARSPVIDDWDLPWGLEIVFIIMLFYSISAEIFLQHGAKSARKKAIDQLTAKISYQRNQNAPVEIVIKRIEAEIERIRDLREGAFRPWYEWPLLQSFGGLGTLWAALQYFAGAWGSF